MGWVISAGIIIIGVMSGVGTRDAATVCTFWSIAGVIWACAFFKTRQKRIAKKHVAQLFKPYEVYSTFKNFGELCSDIILLIPDRYRGTIEIHLYAGKYSGKSCEVNLSITNFNYRNMRDVCPAYLYADSIGWEVSHGMIRTKDDTRLIVTDSFEDKLWSDGSIAAFSEVLRCFTNNCLVVKEVSGGGVQEDGFFMTYKVK